MSKLTRIFLFCLSLILFIYVVLFISPPTSWNSASIIQILIFFLPFLALLTLLFNMFLDYLPRSLILGLGLTFTLVLQSVNLLNAASIVVTLGLTILLAVFFKDDGLTIRQRVPKLTHVTTPKRSVRSKRRKHAK